MSLEYFKTLSKATVSAYRLAIKTFLRSTYDKEVDYSNLELTVSKYVSEDRNRQQDLNDFLVSLKGRAPKTVKLYLTAVRTFFLENEIELPRLFWRRLNSRVRGSRALTLDQVPSNLQLRKIVQHLPIHGKALYLLLSSSGMRIGETLQLTSEDIDMSSEPVKICIQGKNSKTGNSRYAFISSETKEALEDWLKIRADYLKTAVRRSKIHKKSIEDERVFPFNKETAYMMWGSALKKAGLLKLDPQTKRKTMHPHVLRKFFRSKMATLIPVDIVEALMGHEGYLTEVYRRYSQEDLAKFYGQGEPSLRIFGDGKEVAELKKEVDDNKRQLQELVTNVVAENIGLKAKITQLETDFNAVNRKMDHFTSVLGWTKEDAELISTFLRDLKAKRFLEEEEEGRQRDMEELGNYME